MPDIDTAAALTLEDDPLALATCARYNGAGYDVRLELLGSEGSICAGLDQKIPLRSAVISRTGEDPFGRYPHRALREFGVDDCFVTGIRACQRR